MRRQCSVTCSSQSAQLLTANVMICLRWPQHCDYYVSVFYSTTSICSERPKVFVATPPQYLFVRCTPQKKLYETWGNCFSVPFFIEQIILSLTKRWYATISTQKIIICCKSKQYLVVMIVSHCGNGNGNVLMVMVMPCGNNYLNLPCGNDCLAAFPNLYQEYLGLGSPLPCSHLTIFLF